MDGIEGTLLLGTGGFVAWLVWRSGTATSTRVRRLTVVAGVVLVAASISLAAIGPTLPRIAAAFVGSLIMVIEWLAWVVGATPPPDVADDAPSARALRRD